MWQLLHRIYMYTYISVQIDAVAVRTWGICSRELLISYIHNNYYKYGFVLPVVVHMHTLRSWVAFLAFSFSSSSSSWLRLSDGSHRDPQT